MSPNTGFEPAADRGAHVRDEARPERLAGAVALVADRAGFAAGRVERVVVDRDRDLGRDLGDVLGGGLDALQVGLGLLGAAGVDGDGRVELFELGRRVGDLVDGVGRVVLGRDREVEFLVDHQLTTGVP
jgi:hypothetical protein